MPVWRGFFCHGRRRRGQGTMNTLVRPILWVCNTIKRSTRVRRQSSGRCGTMWSGEKSARVGRGQGLAARSLASRPIWNPTSLSPVSSLPPHPFATIARHAPPVSLPPPLLDVSPATSLLAGSILHSVHDFDSIGALTRLTRSGDVDGAGREIFFVWKTSGRGRE